MLVCGCLNVSDTVCTYVCVCVCVSLVTEVDNSEFRSLDSDLDEFHHKATRTLFIGNLDKAVTKDMLRDAFNKFGHIVVSIDVLDVFVPFY